jgi:hypothetical protein
MVTIFSTPKPFRGHDKVIQSNAIQSWTLLHPDAEVILFGDELGAAEVAREYGIRHEPEVRRNERGTKYLNFIFDRARELARHTILCYANCDIMLMSDFREALQIVSRRHPEFLMIGRRWDTGISEPWNFSDPDWEHQLRALALSRGKRNGPSWVDYFAFSRELYYQKMPPFLIGRHGWDPWLTWHALASKVPVVDASPKVVAVHQNHDYGYLARGAAAGWSRQETLHNVRLGRSAKIWDTDRATERLFPAGLRPNYLARLMPATKALAWASSNAWFGFLKLTRPIRHPLGIRSRRA